MAANLLRWSIARGPLAGLLIVAVGLSLSASQAQATLMTIDDFKQPNPAAFLLVSPGSNPFLQHSDTSTGAIGGQRDMLLHVIGQGMANSASGLVGHDVSFVKDAFQLGTNGAAPTVATLQYSGVDTANTSNSLVNAHGLGGGSGMDLTGSGSNDHFLIQFLSVDAQPTTGLDMALTVTSPGGGSSTTSLIIPNSITPSNVTIPFTQLVGSAALNHIDSITVVFNGVRQTPNIDFEIQGITAVPEPAAFLTMAVGGLLFCTGSIRRFRRGS